MPLGLPWINLFDKLWGLLHPSSDIDGWLQKHPNVRDALVWEDLGGVPLPYPQWSAFTKKTFWLTVDLIAKGGSPGFPDAPPLDWKPNLTDPTSVDYFAQTWLAPDDAIRCFHAYAAQTIALEMTKGVPWSILQYTPDQLAMLLDSRSLFRWRLQNGYDDYQIVNTGNVTPGDPVRTFQFLKNTVGLGTTSRDTIVSLLTWGHANLRHFAGVLSAQNAYDTWQYYGLPPVERMISGTTTARGVSGHWSAACQGTTGFLRAVLRTANIPVAYLVPGQQVNHALPGFVREGAYLSHGDDVYNAFLYSTPPIPVAKFLIDQTKFDQWFSPNLPDATIGQNIGRRCAELAIEYLSTYLLRLHCADQQAGLDHALSTVLKNLAGYGYTLADLDAANLWTLMDQKISGFGGCRSVP